MSISVPAARLTPFNPGGPGFCGGGGAPRGFGVAPGARAGTGVSVCEVKTLEIHSVLVQIAINWAERQGDTDRLHRLLRHAKDLERALDRRLTTARAVAARASVSETA